MRIIMANRFTTKKEYFSRLSRIRVIYIICPLLLLVFFLSLSSIQESTLQKQQESLKTALIRDITHCYAVEGFYPPSLDYIEEHYGLTYDKDLFFVDYRPVGSNMRPDVTVILRKGSS